MNKPVVAQAASSEVSSEATAKSWHIASRWQEFEGEMRSAVLRALLVVVFYAIQLVHYLTLEAVAESLNNGLDLQISQSRNRARDIRV